MATTYHVRSRTTYNSRSKIVLFFLRVVVDDEIDDDDDDDCNL
jgi:hypothetical protein